MLYEVITVAEPVNQEEERAQAILRLLQFYARRSYRPVWITDNGLNMQHKILLDALRDAAAEGLCPEDYQTELISSLIHKYQVLSPRDPAEPFLSAYLDLLMSNAFFRLASYNFV